MSDQKYPPIIEILREFKFKTEGSTCWYDELMEAQASIYSHFKEQDTIDHTINIRQEDSLETAFDLFIEKWCSNNAPHLLDSDSNDGEYIRRLIRRNNECS